MTDKGKQESRQHGQKQVFKTNEQEAVGDDSWKIKIGKSGFWEVMQVYSGYLLMVCYYLAVAVAVTVRLLRCGDSKGADCMPMDKVGELIAGGEIGSVIQRNAEVVDVKGKVQKSVRQMNYRLLLLLKSNLNYRVSRENYRKSLKDLANYCGLGVEENVNLIR